MMKSAPILTLTLLFSIAGFAVAQDDLPTPPAPEPVADAPVDAGETVIYSDSMGATVPGYSYGYKPYQSMGYGGYSGYSSYGGYGGNCCGHGAYWTTPYCGRWGNSFRYKSFPTCAKFDVSQSYCKYRTRSPYGPGCGRYGCHGGSFTDCYTSDCCSGDSGKTSGFKGDVMTSEPATDSVLPPTPDTVPEPPAPSDDTEA
jgi:hypothetical protein